MYSAQLRAEKNKLHFVFSWKYCDVRLLTRFLSVAQTESINTTKAGQRNKGKENSLLALDFNHALNKKIQKDFLRRYNSLKSNLTLSAVYSFIYIGYIKQISIWEQMSLLSIHNRKYSSHHSETMAQRISAQDKRIFSL